MIYEKDPVFWYSAITGERHDGVVVDEDCDHYFILSSRRVVIRIEKSRVHKEHQ